VSTTAVVLVVFGALGFAAIGSFVCVIIDRLPVALDEPNEYGDAYDTRPWAAVLGGNSRCSVTDCAAPIRRSDNVPVLSWLVLRGKCRSCEARIDGYHPVVELLCPALFLLSVWAIGLHWSLMPLLWLIPVGVAVAVIDLRTLIVPTRIVWPAFAVTVALSVLAAGLEDRWSMLVTAAVGLAVFAGPLFVLWFIMPGGMGFGDVRLAVLLGWTLGFYAGTRPMGAVVLGAIGLVVASITGIVLGVVALGARGRKAQVPFGPALVTGTFFCVLLAEQILEPFAVYAA
jgi:leader peptidase (prepilin peptidase) / N-methyltransferase